jgi:hypothetical protein
VGKARSLPKSGAPEMCFTLVGSCLTCKQYTILERLSRGKRSSLLQKFVTYDRKQFNNIASRYTTFLSSLRLSENKLECFSWLAMLAKCNITN